MPILPPTTTLQAIETKVRRLTRNPSEAQLATTDLDNYINTFVVYDFPEHLRTFNLRTQFTFFTQPYQDSYPTDIFSFGINAAALTNPLYNFQNRFISVHNPVFIAGYPCLYTQSRDQMFGIYPIINSITQSGFTGDGVTTQFSGTIPLSQGAVLVPGQNQTVSILQNQVLFSSVDANNNGIGMEDQPVIQPSGNNTITGNLYPIGQTPIELGQNPPTVVTATNTINYVTGTYTVTFPVAPGPNAPINIDFVSQTAGLPQALLYYNNVFTVRPIPDQVYRINIEAYMRPSALLSEAQSPALEEWWQYIAYGSAKKIFEDRMQLEDVQVIMPEFKQQERLILRRTLVQYSNERTATIYTEQTGSGQGMGWGWGQSGGPF